MLVAVPVTVIVPEPVVIAVLDPSILTPTLLPPPDSPVPVIEILPLPLIVETRPVPPISTP